MLFFKVFMITLTPVVGYLTKVETGTNYAFHSGVQLSFLQLFSLLLSRMKTKYEI